MGAGRVTSLSLLSGAGTDCVCSVYDTDEADTSDVYNFKMELKNTSNNQEVPYQGTRPVSFQRGTYVALSGTNPRALVHFEACSGHGSVANIRSLGKSK